MNGETGGNPFTILKWNSKYKKLCILALMELKFPKKIEIMIETFRLK